VQYVSGRGCFAHMLDGGIICSIHSANELRFLLALLTPRYVWAA
jgi:hypothetical protein